MKKVISVSFGLVAVIVVIKINVESKNNDAAQASSCGC